MANKHSPGPWEMSDTGGNIYSATGDVVASVHGFPKPHLTGEGAENGRLIAAAPELYAALREVVFAFEDSNADLDASMEAVMPTLRAALAKADGTVV